MPRRTPHAREKLAAPAATRSASGAAPASASDRGDPLLGIFLAAVLVMVGAVVLVTVVDEWWILVPVMLVDFVVTVCVLGALTHLMRGA